ncbi:hypothetical protein SOVF_141850 [Spinacia oleracea]|nr:hypothetical protein SOVF_141850 [Spinacia oleracea]
MRKISIQLQMNLSWTGRLLREPCESTRVMLLQPYDPCLACFTRSFPAWPAS